MKKFYYAFLFIFLYTVSTYSQVSDYVSSLRHGDAKEKSPVTITAELMQIEQISAVNIAYKIFGENEYQKLEMLITGSSASVTLPQEAVIPPYIDYYLIIDLKDGTTRTYPEGIDQGVSTLQLAVSGVTEKDKEIIVLSPTEGEYLTHENLLISVSFVKAPSDVDVSKTKIFLNDADVTSLALFAGDLIVLSGESAEGSIPMGSSLLKIEVYDKEGILYHTISKSFQVVTTEVFAEVTGRWKYFGNLRGESRSENYSSSSTWYNNLSANLNAEYEGWNFNGYLYFTSEEKKYLQPYNRYAASIKNGDWLELRVGDTYPRFPNLILDGKRIRGVSGELNFGAFNIQATYGETVKKIEGQLIRTYQAGEAPLGSNIIAIDENKYNAPYGEVSLGTFSRNLLAIRPSFGSGENFQWGFTYLHSIDDKESVELNARPQENAVFGTDMKIALDDQNFVITSQAAVSMHNTDISSGNLTDAQIDSIFGGDYYSIDPDDVKKIRDILGKFITVNQFVGPLNPQEFASLAGEAALNMNYLNNALRVSYIYRGNDYFSFGQSFLRTDVKGINVVDRIRMFDNKLFLSVGYEKLEDNLQETKVATTKYQTINTSLSFFPRTNFPNVTVGFSRFDNTNNLSLKDTTYKFYVVDDLTSRFFVQLSYDFIAGIRHNSSLSFTTQKRDDESYSPVNSTYNSATITFNSYWNRQLSSIFQLVYSSTELERVDRTADTRTTQPYDYVTLVVGGKYKLLEDKLLLSATLSPSFGDFKRQALDLLADYNILANLSLAFQARIYRIPDKATNSIIGLVTRLAF